MTDVTICFTYFRTLALANLRAALYSVRHQDLSRVREIVVLDNNTDDSLRDIVTCVDELAFHMPARVLSCKHGEAAKTQSWSTNVNVREAVTPWVFYTRADYLLDFDAVRQSVEVVESKPEGWKGFITGNGCHLAEDVGVCEATDWRQTGPQFHGNVFDYTNIDTGVWMARRDSFDAVGGFDEALTAWGHAQTDFQYRLFTSGVEFVRIPHVLYYHPQHAAPRDLDLAHQQLAEQGKNLQQLWARYEGAKPY